MTKNGQNMLFFFLLVVVGIELRILCWLGGLSNAPSLLEYTLRALLSQRSRSNA
jgi:hypothetical protein